MTIDVPACRGVGDGGNSHGPAFWIAASTSTDNQAPELIHGMHVACSALSKAAADAWDVAAMANGGNDNSSPGLRAHCHSNCYAAFVSDPDGYHLEAVCHLPT